MLFMVDRCHQWVIFCPGVTFYQGVIVLIKGLYFFFIFRGLYLIHRLIVYSWVDSGGYI